MISSACRSELHDGLRERKVAPGWVRDFADILRQSWEDFSFALEDCEDSWTCQRRFVDAAREIAAANIGKTVCVGSHGNAIALFLNHVDPLPSVVQGSESLVIRPLAIADAPAIARAIEDSITELRRFMRWAHKPKTTDSQRDRIARAIYDYWRGERLALGALTDPPNLTIANAKRAGLRCRQCRSVYGFTSDLLRLRLVLGS